MVGGLQHSYGYPFDLPDFPQTSGAGPEAAELFNPFELGQNGSILQQQNPYTCPRVGSSAAAFYATEAYMGLSRYDLQETNNNYDQHEQPSYRHPQMPRNQFIRPNIISHMNDYHPFSRLSENEHLLILKEELLGDVDDTNMISPSPPLVPNQDLRASQYVGNMNQFEQQPAAAYNVSTTSGNNPGSQNGVSSSKTRIRWTQELHDRFVDRVNRLGGPDKARPKAILQLMDTEGLTIFHIKSHLQKFRNVKYVPESVEVEGRSDKRSNANKLINMETGLQIKEALQLQLDVQMRLHEQLEIQRKLQLSIEEQGKKLKMMLDQQQKTAQNLMESTNSNTKSTLDQEEEDEDQEEVDENCFPIKID